MAKNPDTTDLTGCWGEDSASPAQLRDRATPVLCSYGGLGACLCTRQPRSGTALLMTSLAYRMTRECQAELE